MEAKLQSKQREETKGSCGESPALTTPHDIISHVFSQLDLVDLLNCSLVCKQWCVDSSELREGLKQAARGKVVDKIRRFQHYFSQAHDSMPDFRAFTSMVTISTKGDRIGPIQGVLVGDSFQYRVELALLGLHKNLWTGISFEKQGDAPEMLNVATSVLVMDQTNEMKPNCDVLIIYAGKEEKKDEKTEVEEDTLNHSYNRALVKNMQENIKIRVIYGYGVRNRDGRTKTIYTYCGLYYVIGYEKVDLPEEMKGYIRYTFKLERINRCEKIVPRMVCELAGGSCSEDN